MFTPGEKVGGSVVVARLHTRPGAITFLARAAGGSGPSAYRVVESLDRAANDDAARRSFLLERGRRLAPVRVPGHPSVLESGEDRGVAWVAREFVDGVTLGQLLGALGLRRRAPTHTLAAAIVARAARVLADVVAQGGPSHGALDNDRILVAFDGSIHLVGFLAPLAASAELEDVQALGARLFEACTMRKATPGALAEEAGSLGAIGEIVRAAMAGEIASTSQFVSRLESLASNEPFELTLAALVAAVVDERLERVRAAMPPDVAAELRAVRPHAEPALEPGSRELGGDERVEMLLSSTSAPIRAATPSKAVAAAPAPVRVVGTASSRPVPPVHAPPVHAPPKKATMRLGGLDAPPTRAVARPAPKPVQAVAKGDAPTTPTPAPVAPASHPPPTEAPHPGNDRPSEAASAATPVPPFGVASAGAVAEHAGLATSETIPAPSPPPSTTSLRPPAAAEDALGRTLPTFVQSPPASLGIPRPVVDEVAFAPTAVPPSPPPDTTRPRGGGRKLAFGLVVLLALGLLAWGGTWFATRTSRTTETAQRSGAAAPGAGSSPSSTGLASPPATPPVLAVEPPGSDTSSDAGAADAAANASAPVDAGSPPSQTTPEEVRPAAVESAAEPVAAQPAVATSSPEPAEPRAARVRRPRASSAPASPSTMRRTRIMTDF